MWELTKDQWSAIAVLLGVLLPAIGAFFVYQREARKASLPPTVGGGGLVAIGGALASQMGMKEYINSQEDMSESINKLGRAVHEGTLEIARTSRESHHDMRRIATALETIAQQMVWQNMNQRQAGSSSPPKPQDI